MLKAWKRSSKVIPPRRSSGPLAVTEYLKRVDVFRDLSESEIALLFTKMAPRECPRGTVIFTPESSGERLFILKSGHVDLYRLTLDGRRLTIRRISAGSIFGEMGLLGQSMQGAFAEVVDSALVCEATRDDLQVILRRHPDVALRLLEAIGTRLRTLEDRLEETAFGSVAERLAHFLLRYSNPAGIVMGYTHEQIGEIVAAQRQTITELLNDWQRKGFIETGYRSISLRKPEALQGMAIAVTGSAL